MQGGIKTVAAVLGLGWLGLAGCAPAPVLVTREAPEILRTQATAGWDGRETLGGLWAAHDALPVGQVRLRDPAGGATANVLLLRREAPGRPPLQLSSAAARALGVAPGQARRVELTALRLVPVRESPLAEAPPPATPPGAAPPAPPAMSLAAPAAGRALIVATFAREHNARAVAARLRARGLSAQVVELATAVPPLWQLRVRPATPQDEGPLLANVKAAGFADAYLLPQ